MSIQANIVAHAAYAAFWRKRITNIHRAIIVEAIVDIALRDRGWNWCAADYAGWDFQHEDGTRLEVKQSAALQSWNRTEPSKPLFDIAPRTGYYKDGVEWIVAPGRPAQIYVFAHHPKTDEFADHRDPSQWRFYVLAEARLPDHKTIMLSSIKALDASTCLFGELADTVEAIRRGLS